MELRPYQAEAKDAINKSFADGIKRTLLVLPTGCHKKGEKVLLANGRSIKVEDVKVGDKLLGADGTVRNVLHLTKGAGDLYKVTPIKGKPFIVSEDHKLTLVRTNEKSCPKYPSQDKGGEIVDITVKEWFSWSKNKKHIHKLIRSGGIEEFIDHSSEERTIDPYFLGVLLGDGGLSNNINVTTKDDEVVTELYRQAEKYNMDLRVTTAGLAKTYHFKDKERKSGCKGTKLFQDLKQIGIMRKKSAEKFVPDCYKYGDKRTRIEVIAGLLDTDGSYRECGYDFITKSKNLADDLAFMCRSVGLAAYVKECTKGFKKFFSQYYRVSISGECDKIPCRVKYKQSRIRVQKKSVLRTGFSIEKAGQGEYFGFTVDGDNRYLMDDFTITHNCGKTIVFAKLIEDRVKMGERVLILAHRGELLEQAADKLQKATGLMCAVEKANQSAIDSWYRVTVGSVQTLMREKRLSKFPHDYYDLIVIDEAHHSLAESYQNILKHFAAAKVLGVTATPDRGDMRSLGEVFESLAYEYTLPRAIKEGYLCRIKAQTIPINLDLSGVGISAGDFKAGDLGDALDPYLEEIAKEMVNYCHDRKTVVFLPLVSTSQKFRDILNKHGFMAAEVNGESKDRAEILRDFDEGKYNVLCNSMLLTEGWDCPSVDCVIVLRPTKVRSLYSQMVGRGTRLARGKEYLLLLDFLWHSERHELCHPASVICSDEKVEKKATEILEENDGLFDLEELVEQAESDCIREREAALAEKLKEMRHRKRKLVDPLQFEMSIAAEDLAGYTPTFAWEMAPPSAKQLQMLESMGIFPDEIGNAGKASLLIERLKKRRAEGLSTPKQIRFLEQRGFQNVGLWEFEAANKMIGRIANNGWRVPRGIDAVNFKPEKGSEDEWSMI